MTELLTSAQMRAIEDAAIASGDVTGLELMERAGRGVIDAIFAEWPEFAPVVAHRGPAPGPRSICTKARPGVRLCCAGRGTTVATGLSWRVS